MESNRHHNIAQQSWPQRIVDHLYCPAVTYLCAIGQLPHGNYSDTGKFGGCIPCAYKICNFDIALDTEFSKKIPNQRPEQCPRSFRGSQLDRKTLDNDVSRCRSLDGTMYKRGMSVLTVGDGDFSFSLALARLVIGSKFGDGSVDANRGRVVATSYEDIQTLQRVYPQFDETLKSLHSYSYRDNNIVIGYNVDATKLDETLPKETQNTGKKKRRRKFHRICWNFPCTAIGNGQDGQNEAMEQNKELVRMFVANALPYLDDECGEIHMAHKTKPPYNQWGLEKVALEGINQENGKRDRIFEYKGRVVFDRCNLPPYTPRKALDRKSFPCHDACIYVFGWKTDSSLSSSLSKSRTQFSSSIPETELDESSCDSPNPSLIIPVTARIIQKIRFIHLKNASGRKRPKTGMGKKQSHSHNTKHEDRKNHSLELFEGARDDHGRGNKRHKRQRY